MSGYILSVLGIVVAGVLIDIVVPSGTINKYIKSIYSIFVVAVLISPIINFFKTNNGLNFQYDEYETNQTLLNYIFKKRAYETENILKMELTKEGFNNVDIKIEFSSKDDEMIYTSCSVFLQNLVIDSDKQHINKYEFIKKLISKHTNLTYEVIVFNE